MNGLIGKKVGMTSVYSEDGTTMIPVTVIEVGPCTVLQCKTEEKDGYSAVQVGFDSQKEHRVPAPMLGHFKKAGSEPKRVVREFRASEGEELSAGQTLGAGDVFAADMWVDVTARSKGRGFQGVVKRYNFRGGRKTHGGHMHRRGGSIGQCVSPARVAKGRKMPGHMGNRIFTTQNLKVVSVLADDNAILIRGAVPGPNGGYVTVRHACKKPAPALPTKAAPAEEVTSDEGAE